MELLTRWTFYFYILGYIQLVVFCDRGESNIPIKTTQPLKTEPRIKREIGYILCNVHKNVWKWPVVKYKHIKTKPRICVLFILCLIW